MATVLVRPDPQKFAVGASMAVYSSGAGWQPERASGPPPGSLVETQTVAAGGVATFLLLVTGVEYVGYASGPDRYWRFEASSSSDALVSGLALKADKARAPLNVKDYGATGDGSTDDATAILAAFAAVPATGGTLFFPRGIYLCSAQINLDSRVGVRMRGEGGQSDGATAGSSLRYTGTAATFISAKSVNGFDAVDIQLGYTNSGFTGFLIDHSHAVSNIDAANITYERVLFAGAGIRTAAGFVNLDNAIIVRFISTVFENSVSAVRGRAAGGNYSNVVTFVSCIFLQTTAVPVTNLGQSWSFYGCTFEGLVTSGGVQAGAGAIDSSGSFATSGTVISGCWFGDATAAGSWITWSGAALSMTGNYMTAGVTQVVIGGSSYAIDITGNQFLFATTAVSIAANCKHVNLYPNEFTSLTNKFTLGGARPLASTLPGAGDVVTQDAPSCRVYSTTLSPATISTGVVTSLGFDTERFDTDTMHDTVTNNGRITIRTAGKYLIGAQIRWTANTTGTRAVDIKLNGATRIAHAHSPATATLAQAQNLSTIYDLAVNDYLEVEVYQDTAGSLALQASAAESPEFYAAQIA